MSVTRATMTGTLLLAAVVGGACTDSVGPESRPASSPERPGISDVPPDASGAHGIDAEFTRLSRQIPGFGGMYYDRSHRLHVYVASAANRVKPARWCRA